MKKISIVTACFNEEENVEELYRQVKEFMGKLKEKYTYEHIFIDNASEDKTVDILKNIANDDKNVKIIVNSRNFGHIKSPTYALFQATGDAVISVVADLQDPPAMILDFVREWENGSDIVLAQKKGSEEHGMMFKVRELYYKILSKLSEVQIFKNCTGFGLFDKKVMDALKTLDDPYPFFRGMLAEVGYSVKLLPYDQPMRVRGVTKNNFYSLYDMGMLGIINNSKVPLRMAIFIGAFFGILSAVVGVGYFMAKLMFWDTMSLGMAPLLIMTSFMFSVMLFFIGIIGEYIGAIYTQVLKRPLVFEKERINFNE